MSTGQHVTVIGVGTGVIARAFPDARGAMLYSVKLDNPTLTPTGTFLCRDFEIKEIA